MVKIRVNTPAEKIDNRTVGITVRLPRKYFKAARAQCVDVNKICSQALIKHMKALEEAYK